MTAKIAPPVPPDTVAGPKNKPKRKPLPDSLPRNEQVLSPGEACGKCGEVLKKLGEDVTEELEYVPGRFIVNRFVRPRMACTCCEAICQAPLPSRPIERGRPGPGLLAHVLVSKYADHLPLYRQSRIFDRDGTDLDRVDNGRILNPEGLRHPDEFVRHKMLDAVGDLTLAGAPIIGRYTGVKAGHEIFNLLLRKLFSCPESWTWCDLQPEQGPGGTLHLPGVHVSDAVIAV